MNIQRVEPKVRSRRDSTRGKAQDGLLSRARKQIRAICLYLGSISAALFVWKKLATQLGVSLSDARVIGIAVLPIVGVFLLEGLPRLLEQRRKRAQQRYAILGESTPGYFRTLPWPSGSVGNPVAGYSRADGAHEMVVSWVTSAKVPILHLTGVSGTGKTSLLNAFALPVLQGSPYNFRTIRLRSFADPLADLRRQLQDVWKRPPEVGDEELRESLERAVAYLVSQRPRERLLLVFDQFEELLILHSETPDGSALVKRVAEFLVSLEERPIDGLIVLLSYRLDYKSGIARIGLHPIDSNHDDGNWRDIEPFSIAAARSFLTGSGLEIHESRMEQILSEALRIEDHGERIRPIILNVLGLVLENMLHDPKGWQRREDLLSDYLRDQLDRPEQRGTPRRILPNMISSAATVRPCRVGVLVNGDDDAASVSGCLGLLGRSGLVRCLNPESQRFEERKWEIAHDFIARLLAVQLATPFHQVWKRIRPYAAAFVIVAAPLVVFVYPEVRVVWATRALDRLGVASSPERAEPISRELFDQFKLAAAARHLAIVAPRTLDLSRCTNIHDLRPLSRLSHLKALDLSFCPELRTLDGLENSVILESIDLEGCRNLKELDALSSAGLLREANLKGCENLADVRGLGQSRHLELLAANGCSSLQSLDVCLPMANLKELRIDNCTALTNFSFLRGLSNLVTFSAVGSKQSLTNGEMELLRSLEFLNLSYSANLADVSSLTNLVSLRRLNLDGCDALDNIEGLGSLKSLQILSMISCKRLQSINGLYGATSIQTLALNQCWRLRNVDGLSNLTDLASIGLAGCWTLDNVDGLRDARQLISANLDNCRKLANITGLSSSTNLSSIELTDCRSLRHLNGMPKAGNVTAINLTDCRMLEDISGLSKLRSLRSLNLTRVPRLKALTVLQSTANIETLILNQSDQIGDFTNVATLRNLKQLQMRGFSKLDNIDFLRGHPTLEHLDVSDAEALKKIDALYELDKLALLSLNGCVSLDGAQLFTLQLKLPRAFIQLDTRPVPKPAPPTNLRVTSD